MRPGGLGVLVFAQPCKPVLTVDSAVAVGRDGEDGFPALCGTRPPTSTAQCCKPLTTAERAGGTCAAPPCV